MTQNASTFYGLTKAAGVDMKDSSNAVGTYTPEAKGAIQKMLGVSDLIATEENNLVASKTYAIGDVFTANGKLYKATAAIAADGAIIPAVEGEEIEGANCVETSVGEGFVKFTDYATSSTGGVFKTGTTTGTGLYLNPTSGMLFTSPADTGELKTGTNTNRIVSPSNAYVATFYGLAKAAGDTTQAASDNAVGTYTSDA